MAEMVEAERILADGGFKPYHLELGWRAPIRGTFEESSTEYPDLFETRAGQEEDQLTDTVLRNGFTAKSVVQASCNSNL